MESIKRVMDQEAEFNARDVAKKIAYYNGNFDEVKNYLEPYLKFEKEELADMPWQITNIIKKVIIKNSFIYKSDPNRKVESGQETYDKLTVGKNNMLRLAERQANLLYDIAFYVGWDEKNSRFAYKPPYRYFKPIFDDDDQIHPIGIMFPVDTPLNKPARWEKWTVETISYLLVDADGLVRNDPNKPAVPNELKTLPFIFIHKGDLIDAFHTGSTDDLINANEILNLSLTILNYLERDTSYRQVWGTGIEATEKVVSRYNRMLASQNDKATFGVLDMQTNLQSNIEKIKFNISLILANYNMEPKWATEGGGTPSGFSLVVKNMDLLEAWEQAVPIWRVVENEIFELEKKIAGLKSKGGFDGFSVNFADINFPIDKAEERADIDWMISHGYMSDLDAMRKRDIDGTDEELSARLEENRARIGKLKGIETEAGKPKPKTLEERLAELG